MKVRDAFLLGFVAAILFSCGYHVAERSHTAMGSNAHMEGP